MAAFSKKEGVQVMLTLTEVIQQNKEYLSTIDGAIGDGDHGINMNKGFSLFKERVKPESMDMETAMNLLGKILLTEIGGSMGPIYGTFFLDMASVLRGRDNVDAPCFSEMLNAARSGIQDLGNAQRGDKTLLDTLIPACEAFAKALSTGFIFTKCLDAMESGAKAGWESTKDMEAKLGRSSRLGKRSVGVLDAGATSCWLILKALSDGARQLLAE